MTIQTILKGEPETVSPDAPLGGVVDMLARHGALLVSADGSSFDGVLCAQDLAPALRRFGPYACCRRVRDVMSRNAIICGPDDKIDEVAARMERHRSPVAAVVDKGVAKGLVSALDIIRLRLRKAEAEKDAIHAYINAA